MNAYVLRWLGSTARNETCCGTLQQTRKRGRRTACAVSHLGDAQNCREMPKPCTCSSALTLATDTSINTYIPTRDLAHSSAPLAENTRDRVSARLPSSGPGHHPWTTRGQYPYQPVTNSRNVASSPKLVIQKTQKCVEKLFRILKFVGVYSVHIGMGRNADRPVDPCLRAWGHCPSNLKRKPSPV